LDSCTSENVASIAFCETVRTAVAGNVDRLVTGDNDLLTLGEFASIPILSPRQFCARLGQKRA
jgi:predicted nucleic acid-binding protein